MNDGSPNAISASTTRRALRTAATAAGTAAAIAAVLGALLLAPRQQWHPLARSGPDAAAQLGGQVGVTALVVVAVGVIALAGLCLVQFRRRSTPRS